MSPGLRLFQCNQSDFCRNPWNKDPYFGKHRIFRKVAGGKNELLPES